MEFLKLKGSEMAPVLPALAELRIRVFRDWPYLYDGSLEYEAQYLRKFSSDPHAFIAIAKDGENIVGASTASPLLGHADAFAAPFSERGFDPARVFYFGESVLLPQYRGRGLGHKFFEAREEHARNLGRFDIAAFCGVVRDQSDPRKPADYAPLDPFWKKRGFEKAEGFTTSFSWKEELEGDEIAHPMQFWIKKL